MRVVLFLFTLMLLSGLNERAFAQTATPIALSADEIRFGQIINQFRQILHLPVLTDQVVLDTIAKSHSDWMTAQNTLDHYEPSDPVNAPFLNSPFDRMKAAGYSKYFYAGENIACGNMDPMKTFRQWAFSPGHLLNMINAHYHEMGIARSGPGIGNCPYFWTNDFGSVTDPTLDPPGTVDLNLITQAIVQVSGPIPVGTTVSLTEPTPTPTPASAPAPASAIASAQIAGPAQVTGDPTIASIHCTIPYSVGQNILTNFANTDTVIDAKRDDDGTYSVKLSYLQNGQSTNIYPIAMSGLTVTRNPDYPVFTLISAPGSRVGGYSIEIDLGANHAQFDSYGVSPQVTASLVCTVKY